MLYRTCGNWQKIFYSTVAGIFLQYKTIVANTFPRTEFFVIALHHSATILTHRSIFHVVLFPKWPWSWERKFANSILAVQSYREHFVKIKSTWNYQLYGSDNKVTVMYMCLHYKVYLVTVCSIKTKSAIFLMKKILYNAHIQDDLIIYINA